MTKAKIKEVVDFVAAFSVVAVILAVGVPIILTLTALDGFLNPYTAWESHDF